MRVFLISLKSIFLIFFLTPQLALSQSWDCSPDLIKRSFSAEEIINSIKNGGFGYSNIKLHRDSVEAFLRVSFPRNSVDPAGFLRLGTPIGGAGGLLKLDQLSSNCIFLSYKLRFAQNFDFVKGGKLPGLAGGVANTGGNIPNGKDGFSARFMWRQAGEGEVYAYLPDSKVWGTSLGRGEWAFKVDEWLNIIQLVKLNDPGEKNGQILIWFNDELVYVVKNLRFRDVGSLLIDTIRFETFFGGNTKDWASKEDTYIDFKDFKVSSRRDGLIGK